MIEKLILGTAGLGGNAYGRNGRSVTEKEAKEIFEYAYSRGIRVFDTSPEYGDAEKWVGEWRKTAEEKHDDGIPVYTKNRGDRDQLLQSWERLGYCTPLFHNWMEDSDVPYWTWGGLTTYQESFEAALGMENFEVIQVNWNLLSQMELPDGDDLKGHRIHIRSVFLQGVLAGSALPDKRLQKAVAAASRLAAYFGMTLKQLALWEALHTPASGVVIGPTSMDELEECLEIASMEAPKNYVAEMVHILSAPELDCTDPRVWS